jgi:short-subunit dehydrogenase
LVKEIEASGGTGLAITCDVTQRQDVLEAVKEAQTAVGPIDRLIANAGAPGATDIDHLSAKDIERIISLNVIGVANAIEAVLPEMLRRGAGHLIATSSLAAYGGLPGSAGYSASKAALTNMMESLRIDLKPRGIDVTTLSPGFVRTSAFGMKKEPFQLELEDATERMHRAIRKRKRYYAFPMPLVIAVWIGRLLPRALYDRNVAQQAQSRDA